MTLNKEHGEVIEGLGAMFRVVDVEKWAGTGIYEQAALAATEAFRKSEGKFFNGNDVIQFGRNEVVAQEYPLTDKLAFIFERRVNGQEMVYPYVFSFPPEMIDRMVSEGHWDRTLVKLH
jgi:hypothetical protein